MKDTEGTIQKKFIEEKLQEKLAYKDNERNPRLRTIIDIANSIVRDDDTVLDVGCGDCYVLMNIKKCINKFGIDLSDKVLALSNGGDIELQTIDIECEKLPYENKTIDFIISTEVIEHVLNTDNYIAEINRVCKNRGKLLLSFPNINNPLSWYAQIFFDFPPLYSSRYKSVHTRDFTLKIIRLILKKYGFKIIHIKGMTIPFIPVCLSNLLCKISPRWGATIIILAEKIKDADIDNSFVLDTRDLFK